jgi:hypothetical protein
LPGNALYFIEINVNIGYVRIKKERSSEIKKKVVNNDRLKSKEKFLGNTARNESNICANASCRMRKAGCSGFEGCPGFKSR